LRSRLLWSGLGLLIAIGVTASITRALSVTHTGLSITEARLKAGRAMFPEHWGEDAAIEQRFADNRALTLLHVVPGGVFLLLAPLQFSSAIRNRHRRFHRWSGRVIALLSLLAGISGLWIGLVLPYAGNERLPIALFGVLFLLAPLKGIRAIRRGDVAHHREWMIRLFAVGIGIAVVRVVAMPMITILRPERIQDIMGLSFWTGWSLSVIVAELWIRSTRLANVEAGFSPPTAA
jgi:uncharacterized membrane protein